MTVPMTRLSPMAYRAICTLSHSPSSIKRQREREVHHSGEGKKLERPEVLLLNPVCRGQKLVHADCRSQRRVSEEGAENARKERYRDAKSLGRDYLKTGLHVPQSEGSRRLC